jgi:hypothetical protein
MMREVPLPEISNTFSNCMVKFEKLSERYKNICVPYVNQQKPLSLELYIYHHQMTHLKINEAFNSQVLYFMVAE